MIVSNVWIGVVVVAVVVVAGAALLIALFKGKGKPGTDAKNRKPDRQPTWDSNDVPGSLAKLLQDVEADAKSATDWYWAEKGPKARASRIIQASSVILTALAALVPVGGQLLQLAGGTGLLTSGLWATVLVGSAAGLLGLDRAFGFSSAWARYVLAATEINRRLAEFRMDWLALSAVASQSSPLSADQVAVLVQKAKEFRMAVEAVVVQETKDWATEFQNNLAQLEKDVKAQLETLKAQVEKQQKEKEAASQPGSIEATVTNADKTQDFTFTVGLDGADGPVVKDEKIGNNKTWTRLNVKPGQYTLKITAATIGTPAAPSKPVSVSSVVPVKTGELAKASIALPIP